MRLCSLVVIRGQEEEGLGVAVGTSAIATTCAVFRFFVS